MTQLLVRERAPLRLDIGIETPGGRHARWGLDEHSPASAPGSLTFSSTMPGGFEQASCVLTREPEADYPDLEELSAVTVRGAGGDIAWQGRLEKTPRASGDAISISPAAVGYQAHLDDDASAAMAYVDRDLGAWHGPSIQRQLDLAALNLNQLNTAAAAPDPGGIPALGLEIDGTWAAPNLPDSQAWYGPAVGWRIQKLFWSMFQVKNVALSDAHWTLFTWLCDDDRNQSASRDENDLVTTGGSSGYQIATSDTRRYAQVEATYAVTPGPAVSGAQNGADGNQMIWYMAVAVYGDHGLTGRGGDPVGFFMSDVVAHAVGRWAPKLATSFAGQSTIRQSNFVIPHLVFLTLTTASQIVKGATRFELPDWAVWEGPTFWCYPRPSASASLDDTLPPKRWRARVYPAKLSETGPQVDRLFNGALVSYTDVTGQTLTVGPPGANADVTDSRLLDADPSNPANEAGIRRWTLLQMGTATSAAAIQVGATFLAEQKLLDSSGQAALVGHVEDDHGVLWPAWRVRAGDQISFVDAADTSYRRIIRPEYDDPSKTCTISLDAPPQGLQALLERLQVVIAPLGF